MTQAICVLLGEAVKGVLHFEQTVSEHFHYISILYVMSLCLYNIVDPSILDHCVTGIFYNVLNMHLLFSIPFNRVIVFMLKAK
jgi:hypothetical protein